MKNSFFNNNKKTIGIIACIIGFALITLFYFYPVMEGKMIKQSDVERTCGLP